MICLKTLKMCLSELKKNSFNEVWSLFLKLSRLDFTAPTCNLRRIKHQLVTPQDGLVHQGRVEDDEGRVSP